MDAWPRLMIPGPVDVDPRVLSELSGKVAPHFGASWLGIIETITALLRPFFGTTGDIILMPGPGTGALDAALSSLVPPGQGICVVCNGFFGDRLCLQAAAFGLKVYRVAIKDGQAIDPTLLRRELSRLSILARRDGSRLKALALVHHETSTGVLNPLSGVAAVAAEFELPVIVDAVASLGGVDIRVDDWGLDVCVGVPNKCLGGIAGVAILAVSDRAWALAEANKGPRGWYHDLHTWAWHRRNVPDRPYPSTVPTNVILALRRALELVREQGFEAHFAQYPLAAERVRVPLRDLGFRLFSRLSAAAPMLSVFRTIPACPVRELIVFLCREFNVLIADGLPPHQGRLLRVGHMGQACSLEYGEILVKGIEHFLKVSY